MNASNWRGLVAIVTTAVFGAGWTAGFLIGRVDGTLYLAGMSPFVSAVATFYFAHELRNGIHTYDKLMKDTAYMERMRMVFDRYITEKRNSQ